MLNLPPILAVLLAIAGTPQAEARALVERAIQAQGGRDALAQRVAVWSEFKVKSYVTMGSEALTITGESWTLLPGRVRYRLATPVIERVKITLDQVVDGNRGWSATDGAVEVLSPDSSAAFHVSMHAEWASSLLPLLTDRRFRLTPAEEAVESGRPVQRIRAAFPGQPDVLLSFDKETGLLARTRFRWKKKTLSIVWNDYRELDSVREEREVLRREGLSEDGPTLLGLLRQWTPSTDHLRRTRQRVAQLGSPSFKAREAAQNALSLPAPFVRPLLEQAAAGKDPEAARRARAILERFPPKKAEALTIAIVRLIAQARPEGAAAVLRAYLPAAKPEVAREVRWALAEIDPALMHERNQPGRRLYPRGLKLPRRYSFYEDRQKAEFEVLRVRFYNRFEDRIFAKP